MLLDLRTSEQASENININYRGKINVFGVKNNKHVRSFLFVFIFFFVLTSLWTALPLAVFPFFFSVNMFLDYNSLP